MQNTQIQCVAASLVASCPTRSSRFDEHSVESSGFCGKLRSGGSYSPTRFYALRGDPRGISSISPSQRPNHALSRTLQPP